MYTKEKEILPAYISKHNSTREKQIILLMIPNEEKEESHYLVVKKLSVLLHGITSKHSFILSISILLEKKRTSSLVFEKL